MSRIVFAFFALTFVQMVRSQSEQCQAALLPLIASNEECSDMIETADPSVCSGTCGQLLDAIQTACEDSRDNSDINQIYLGIETICNSDENCTAALVELNGNTDCVNAIVNDNNALQCSASCRTLVTTALDTCPDNEFTRSQRNEYNQDCGSAASVLQASGIILLLLLAISVLIA